MRILGLDIGSKRIGVAVSDPLGITAQGLEVVSYNKAREAIEQIARLCREYEAEKIVVGLPLNMDGSKGPAAREAEDFATTLAAETGLPFIMVDERLTTKAVERTLISGNVRRSARKSIRDKLAAVLILETFLTSAGSRKD